METWVQKAETEKRVNKSCLKMRRRFHDYYIFPDSKYMSFDFNFTFWCLILPQVHLCLVIPGCQKKTHQKNTQTNTQKNSQFPLPSWPFGGKQIQTDPPKFISPSVPYWERCWGNFQIERQSLGPQTLTLWVHMGMQCCLPPELTKQSAEYKWKWRETWCEPQDPGVSDQ